MSKEKVEQSMSVKKNSIWQSIISGSIAGGAEVLIDHPLWTIKTRMQSGQKFTFSPQTLYRGILPNAASMIPITAIQVAMNGFFKNHISKDGKTSVVQDFMTAFGAGAGSSLIGSPTELVMTHQGKKTNGFFSTLQFLIRNHGYKALRFGLPSCAIRDGFFSAFYQSVTPAIKHKLRPYVANDYVLSLCSGVTAGVMATGVSHAFDTVKTVQQTSDLNHPKSMVQAAKTIVSQHGAFGFFKGIVPRGARVVSAVTIMSYATEKMNEYFQNPESPKMK